MRILAAIKSIKLPTPIYEYKKSLNLYEHISNSLTERQIGQVFDDVFRNYLIYLNTKANKKIIYNTIYRGKNIERYYPSKENIKEFIMGKFRSNKKPIESETQTIYDSIHSIDYNKFITKDTILIDSYLGFTGPILVDRYGFRHPKAYLKPDIGINETIIDVKFIDKITFSREYFCQLLLYYIWVEYLKRNEKPKLNIYSDYHDIHVTKLGIYYAKFDFLWEFSIDEVISGESKKIFLDFWFDLIDNNYPNIRNLLYIFLSYTQDTKFFERNRKLDQFSKDILLFQLKIMALKLKFVHNLNSEFEDVIIELIMSLVEDKYREIKYDIRPSSFLPDNDIVRLGTIKYLECNFIAHSKYFHAKKDSIVKKLSLIKAFNIENNILVEKIRQEESEYDKLIDMNFQKFNNNHKYFDIMINDLKKFLAHVGVDGGCKYYLTDKREVYGQHYFNSWPNIGDKVRIQLKDKSTIEINSDDIKKIEVFDIYDKIIRTFNKKNVS
jgi:hypothetical protein